MIGSYPKFDGKNFSTDIVIRGRDVAAIEAAEADVRRMLDAIIREKGGGAAARPMD